MLTLIAPLILLIASLATLSVHIFHWRAGLIWLSAIIASLLAWILILVYHFVPVSGLNLIDWSPLSSTTQFIAIQFDTVSWPLAFSMATILLTVIFTYPTTARFEKKPARITSLLLLFFTSLMAILSATPLALLMAWSFYDLVDGFVLIKAGLSNEGKQSLLLNLVFKTMSSFIIIWSVITSASESVMAIGQFGQKAALLVITAVCIRAWSTLITPVDRFVNNVSKEFTFTRLLTGTAAAIAILGRLPGVEIQTTAGINLQIVVALVSLISCLGWLLTGSDQKRLAAWLFALSSLGILSSIRGNPDAAVIWGVVMILVGPGLLVFSTQSKPMAAFPIIGLIALSGMPLTLASPGWAGFLDPRFDAVSVLTLGSYLLLLMGYLKIGLRKTIETAEAERWMSAMNNAGLFICAAAQLSILFIIRRATPLINLWWLSIILFVVTIVLFLLYQFNYLRKPLARVTKKSLIVDRTESAIKVLEQGVILQYIYNIIEALYRVLRKVFNSIEAILEGNAGVIWAALLAVLILSFLQSAGNIP